MTGLEADRQEPADTLRIDVLRGSPTAEELAAVIAVVTESYQAEASSAVVDPAPESAWTVSARAPREPLRRDVPWGRFRG